MENTSDTILKTIAEIEKYPTMFMSAPDFKSLENLLIGYFLGIQDITGIPYNYNISEWVNKKYKKKTSLYWPAYVLLILAKEDEKIAYKLLLENVKKYIKENVANS